MRRMKLVEYPLLQILFLQRRMSFCGTDIWLSDGDAHEEKAMEMCMGRRIMVHQEKNDRALIYTVIIIGLR